MTLVGDGPARTYSLIHEVRKEPHYQRMLKLPAAPGRNHNANPHVQQMKREGKSRAFVRNPTLSTPWPLLFHNPPR